ncbi:hypothetical protein LLEC1_05434 [Akanthomyces lecanii]|uniref:Uncharacterized protein n=1 Tax=Cordyceps confragosa TaxID=2714763 RepID=A0A179I0S4_CORDF|nr:hypothetical protein LLEC1_05434 [Akanthomyces lecanii]
MARKLPWKRASDPQQEPASSPRRVQPKPETPRRTAATPSRAPATRHRPAALVALNSSDPLRSPSTSPPPEPPQERYMLPGDDHYRIVEDELLQTAQRFTTHLHRAEYNRLKLIAKSLPSQTSAAAAGPSSLTKAAVGHRPTPLPAATPKRDVSDAGSFATPASTRRARHPITPASSVNIASSSSTPRRHAKIEAEAPAPEDDLDFDDPFGINKRRLDRQKSRDQLKKTIRSTPTNTPSSSDTMPSFV